MKKFMKFVIVALLLGTATLGIRMFLNTSNLKSVKGTATNEIIKQTLLDSSDLVTQKLVEDGTVYYDNQGIPVLTQSTFYMNYKVTVSAGIDLEKVTIDEIDNDNFKITITAPKAEILDVNVDPDSLTFDQTSLTMFDMSSKVDTQKAISSAADDCVKSSETTSLLENANNQTTTLLKGLMATGFPDYEVTVNLKAN
jgi:hypothetical protein